MNQDQEREFAGQIRRTLELGAERLTPKVSERLRLARSNALTHQIMGDTPRHHGLVTVIAGIPPWLRIAMMALALSIGATGTYYWDQYNQAAEDEIIDSAMLSDELPPGAFHDRGFQAWLNRASDAPSQ
jgi:hypothetical protein